MRDRLVPASGAMPDPVPWRAGEQERLREFRRYLLASVGLHLLAVVGLAVAPERHPRAVIPGAVSVDLVAGLPAPEPPAPAPAAPKPEPPPKPAPPEAAPEPAPKPPAPKVVLPEKPTPPSPKPRARPKPRPRPQPAPAPPPQATYDDVLAELRREAGEPVPTPVASAGARSGAARSGGSGTPVPPEVGAWLRDAQAHVERMWVRPPGFDGAGLVAVVEIELAADGRLLGDPRLLRPSPNPIFNDNALRAAAKASPYPPPPEPGRWTVTFSGDRL